MCQQRTQQLSSQSRINNFIHADFTFAVESGEQCKVETGEKETPRFSFKKEKFTSMETESALAWLRKGVQSHGDKDGSHSHS
jgi:hypothetical protein